MSTLPFAHLHCHSHYSLLDGAGTIRGLLERAKALRMTALALTDHGNLHGAVKFYQTAKELGINPILGLEAYIAPGSRFHKEVGRHEGGQLPPDAAGPQPRRLSQPREALLRGVLGGFLFQAADRQGTAGRPPRRADLPERLRFERAEPHAPGRRRGEHGEGRRNRRLVPRNSSATTITSKSRTTIWSRSGWRWKGRSQVAQRLGIPLVATSDVHYIHREDAEAQDILLCVNTGKFRTDTNRMRMESNEFYLRSAEEMYAAFPGLDDALRRTQEIADSVHIELELGKRHFPVFTPPEGKTSEQYLRELCLAGLKERYAEPARPLRRTASFRPR